MGRQRPPSVMTRLFGGIAVLFCRLLAMLPARPVVALAGGVGGLLARMGLIRRRITRENIRRAFGNAMTPDERRRIEIASGGHFLMSMVESIYLGYRPVEWVNSIVTEVTGEEHIPTFEEGARGILSVSGHFGSWEIAGAWAALRFPVRPISKRLHSMFWHEEMERTRRRYGLDPIWVEDDILPEAVRSIKAGKVVNMLFDQDAGHHGIFVPFFGVPASTTPGPAMIAIRAGVKILPVFIVRLGPARHRVEIHPPIDPADFTGKLAVRLPAIMERLQREIEDMVRLHPAQYFWQHRRWKTTPEAAQRRQETKDRRRAEARESAPSSAAED